MHAIFHFVATYGYSILFAAVFARQIGLPIPANLFLIAAGALAAKGKLGFVVVAVLAVTATVLADWVWYEAGRRDGDKVLHFIHRFMRDPDFHDRQAKKTFARYGLPLLLVAKFVPGLDAVAPPLAGTSHISRIRFLAFEIVGASLWSGTYAGLGFFFRHDLNRAAEYLSRTGSFLLGLALVGICVYYTAHKLIQRFRKLRESRVMRIAPALDRRHSEGTACEMIGGQKNGD